MAISKSEFANVFKALSSANPVQELKREAEQLRARNDASPGAGHAELLKTIEKVDTEDKAFKVAVELVTNWPDAYEHQRELPIIAQSIIGRSGTPSDAAQAAVSMRAALSEGVLAAGMNATGLAQTQEVHDVGLLLAKTIAKTGDVDTNKLEKFELRLKKAETHSVRLAHAINAELSIFDSTPLADDPIMKLRMDGLSQKHETSMVESARQRNPPLPDKTLRMVEMMTLGESPVLEQQIKTGGISELRSLRIELLQDAQNVAGDKGKAGRRFDEAVANALLALNDRIAVMEAAEIEAAND